jgi:hypothetical protein
MGSGTSIQPVERLQVVDPSCRKLSVRSELDSGRIADANRPKTLIRPVADPGYVTKIELHPFVIVR